MRCRVVPQATRDFERLREVGGQLLGQVLADNGNARKQVLEHLRVVFCACEQLNTSPMCLHDSAPNFPHAFTPRLDQNLAFVHCLNGGCPLQTQLATCENTATSRHWLHLPHV